MRCGIGKLIKFFVLPLQFKQVFRELIICLFSNRQIAGHFGIAYDGTIIIVKGRDNYASPKPVSLLRHSPSLVVGLALFSCFCKQLSRKISKLVLFSIEYRKVFSKNFICGIP